MELILTGRLIKVWEPGRKMPQTLFLLLGWLFQDFFFLHFLLWQLVNLEIKNSTSVGAGKSNGLQPTNH